MPYKLNPNDSGRVAARARTLPAVMASIERRVMSIQPLSPEESIPSTKLLQLLHTPLGRAADYRFRRRDENDSNDDDSSSGDDGDRFGLCGHIGQRPGIPHTPRL